MSPGDERMRAETRNASHSERVGVIEGIVRRVGSPSRERKIKRCVRQLEPKPDFWARDSNNCHDLEQTRPDHETCWTVWSLEWRRRRRDLGKKNREGRGKVRSYRVGHPHPFIPPIQT